MVRIAINLPISIPPLNVELAFEAGPGIWDGVSGASRSRLPVVTSDRTCSSLTFDFFFQYTALKVPHAGQFPRVEVSLSQSSSTVASNSCYRNKLPDTWAKRCMSKMSRGPNLWQMGGSKATTRSDMPGCCE